MFTGLLNKFTAISQKKSPSPEDLSQKIIIAASVILLEVAHADHECSAEEFDHISTTVQKIFDLSAGDTHELLEQAASTRENTFDLWQFTNLINQQSSEQEKIRIMETVWQIIYVDGKLDQHEDCFAHKLAKLLRLSHGTMIKAKLKAKNTIPAGEGFFEGG